MATTPNLSYKPVSLLWLAPAWAALGSLFSALAVDALSLSRAAPAGQFVDLALRFSPLAAILLLHLAGEGRGPDAIGLGRAGAWLFWPGLLAGVAWLMFSTRQIAPGRLAGVAWLLGGRLIQAGVEEAWLRGWLLRWAAARWGSGAGAALSAVVFALLHLSLRPGQLAVYALMGLALARLTLAAKNIWPAWGFHTGWNVAVDLWL